jgi:hypothetical protein
VLAARGMWVTNEKELLSRAGLRGVDEVLAGLSAAPGALTAAVDRAADLLGRAVAAATGAERWAGTARRPPGAADPAAAVPSRALCRSP